MAKEKMDEKYLRTCIIRIWGEYGAHVELFDALVTQAERAPTDPTPGTSGLREAAQDLLDGIARQNGPVSPHVAMKAANLRKALLQSPQPREASPSPLFPQEEQP